MDVFNLQASLSLDTSEFERQLAAAAENAKKFASAIDLVTKTSANSGFSKASSGVNQFSENVQRVTSRLDTVKSKLSALSTAGTPFDKIFGGLAANIQSIQNLGTTISKVTHPISTLKTAISDMSDKFRLAGKSQQDLQSAFNSAKSKVDDLTAAYKESADATGEDSKETKDLKKQLDSAIGNMNRAESDLGKYNDQVEETSNSTDKAESKTHKFGSALATVASKAASAVTGLAKIGAGAVTAVTGVVSAIAGSFIKNDIVGGGLNRALNIEQAQFKLKGLGHDAKSVEAIMNDALAAVKGTAYGLDSAATVAASAVAAGIKPGKDLERTLKLVGDAAAISGRDMESMGAIFNKVAASGKMSGDELNQLTNAGIPMLQLLSETLGKTEEEVRELVSAGTIGFAEFQNAIEKGMGGAALKMGETFTGNLANVRAAASRLGASFLTPFTQAMTPALSNAISLLDAIASGNMEGVEENARQMADNVSKAVTGLIENVGSLVERSLPVIGEMVKKLLPVISGAISQIVSIASKLLPDIITLATGIVTAIAGELPALIQSILPALIDGTIQVVTALVQQLPMIFQVISDAMPLLIDAIVTILPMLVETGLQLLAQLAIGIAQALPTLIPTIVEVVLQIVDTLIDNIDLLIDAAIQLMLGLTNGLIDALPILIEKAPTIVQKLVDAIVDATPELLLAAVEIIATLADYILTNLPQIIDAGGKMVWAVIKGIGNVIGKLFSVISGIGSELGYMVYDWIDETKNWIVNKWNAFVSWWQSVFEALGGWVFDKIQVAKDRFKLGLETIKAIFSVVWESISSTTREIWHGIRDAIWSVMDAIKEKIDKIVEIKNTFVEAFQTSMEYLKDLPSKALKWGKDLIDNFVNGIKSKIAAVTNAVSNIANKVKDFLGFSEPEKGALSNFHTFAPDMMKLFAKGIADNEQSVVDKIKSVAASVADAAKFDLNGQYNLESDIMRNVQTFTSSENGNREADATNINGISYAGATININISGADTKNPRKLAERLAEELATLTSDNNSRMGAWAL